MIRRIRAHKNEIISAGGRDIYALFIGAAVAAYIVIFAAFVACFAMTSNAGTVSVKAAGTASGTVKKSDKAIVREYARKHFPGYEIRIRPAEKLTDQELESRAGRRVVYVEYLKTVSRGRYGKVIKRGPFYGRRVNYAKREKRGRKVTVYLIYNPRTAATDDVLAIVNSGAIG